MSDDNIWDEFDELDSEADERVAREIEKFIQEKIANGQGPEFQQEFNTEFRYQPQEFREFEIRSMLIATASVAASLPNLDPEIVGILAWKCLRNIHDALENGELGWFQN